MFSLFKTKYTEDEKRYLLELEKLFSAIFPNPNEAESTAKKTLDEAINRAEKAGLRGVKTMGNNVIKNESYISKRLKAGLTKEDVLGFLNRDYVWIAAESILVETHHFSVYMALMDSGKSSIDAVSILRKQFIYCDNPESSHPTYQGEDADIYPEFTMRHEVWRSRLSPSEVQELASSYSTYNAMVRDLIRKGKL